MAQRNKFGPKLLNEMINNSWPVIKSHMNTTLSAKHALNLEPINVFTYGSLMYRDIFEQVTGCRLDCVSARAHQWRRYGLVKRTYPGAMPCGDPSAAIDGVLWLNVPERALNALDEFEAAEYGRVEIKVTSRNNAMYPAFIYQWSLPEQIHGEWDPVDFERHHRHDFARIHGAKQG